MMSPKSNNKKRTTTKREVDKVKCFSCEQMISTNSVSINRDGTRLCIACYHDCCWELRKSAITGLEARAVQKLRKEHRASALHYILGVRAFKRAYKSSLEEAYVAILTREQELSETTYKKDMTCLTTQEHISIMEAVLKSFELTGSFKGISSKIDNSNAKGSIRPYRRHYFGLHGLTYLHY